MDGSRVRRRSGLVGTALAACLVAVLTSGGAALATNVSDFSVTPATGGGAISASTASAEWTTLTGPVINVVPYSNPDVIPANALVFQMQLPANFEWNTAKTTAPIVTVAPGSPAGFCTLAATSITYWSTPGQKPVYSYAQFGLSGTHDVGCQITVTGLQVRPISSNPAAGTGGNIAVTWTLNGAQSTPQNGGVVTMAASASAVIIPATGGTNIPASSAGGAWTTLAGPTITEGASGQLSSAQIVLALPANFVFNPGITAPPTASCGYPITAITYFGTGNQATNAQITVQGHATMSACSISFGQLLQVRPISGDPSAGTGGNIAVSIDGAAAGNGGQISMVAPSGPLTLTTYSPTMNNNAIIWGQSYVDLSTTGAAGTVFQIEASTDEKTWTPLKDSNGAVLTFTITSAARRITYRYTPIRNYWYRSVAGATKSNTARVTVRQTVSISPSNSATVTIGPGSKITFTTTSRPVRSDLPTANVMFQLWQKSSSGSWVLHTQVTKAIDWNGNVAWPVTFSTTGSFYVRAQTQPTSVNSNSFWTANQYYTVG